ncbi:MAG: hypothetical protein LLF97_05265 [Planctomycetaceae bacterium]|nr:hypothetical protein [Planctomycetaceae bacterium]
MTASLQEAFQKASSLPEAVQELLAQELLEEIEWESRWDETLAGSQSLLDRLTAKAMREYRDGKTEAKGFDEL